MELRDIPRFERMVEDLEISRDKKKVKAEKWEEWDEGARARIKVIPSLVPHPEP